MIISVLIAFIVSIQSVTGSFPIHTINAVSESSQARQTIKKPIRDYTQQSLGVEISAKSAVVVDFVSGKILYKKNIDQKLPIASLSKLMTALVFLDHNPGWDKLITMSPADEVYRGKYIYRGEQVTVRDLFNVSLIGSDNNATHALVRSTGLTQKQFVDLMNLKAQELGMKNTFFIEVTGLNAKNVSSVSDLNILANKIWRNEDILSTTGKKVYHLTIKNTKTRRLIHSTNKLLGSYLQVKAGKTGFIDEAGYCLASLIANQEDNKIVVIVLGSKEEEDRFQDSKALAWWVFKNYIWEKNDL